LCVGSQQTSPLEGPKLTLVLARSSSDRVFTSRSEFRISHRADNADLRLTPLAHAHGLVAPERWEVFEDLRQDMDVGRQLLRAKRQSAPAWVAAGVPMATSPGTSRASVALPPLLGRNLADDQAVFLFFSAWDLLSLHGDLRTLPALTAAMPELTSLDSNVLARLGHESMSRRLP
jgi:hypothetical protein